MLISSSLPSVRSQSAPLTKPAANESNTFHLEPIDGWNPGDSKAMAELAPYSLGVIGAAAGLVAGFAEGPAAMVGGAIALGAAGTAGAVFLGALSELGGDRPNYGRTALLGAGIGAGLGAWAGSVGGPLVGIGAAVLGAGGAFLAGTFAQD